MMNYQNANIVNCLDDKFCNLSESYVNAIMYGLCYPDKDKLKLILLIKFLINSSCKPYSLKCLLENINCP